jgi:NAD-specific glutamate dehydrogenase
MGGDVFGNALKRSPNVRLRAAFNHQHVFLDPEPRSATAFTERLRLFNGVLGWGAYDPSVRSRAAAPVVPRAAKKVTLSEEAAAMLGLTRGDAGERRAARAGRPRALDVDLLFNGGIGTYVGATGQRTRTSATRSTTPSGVRRARSGQGWSPRAETSASRSRRASSTRSAAGDQHRRDRHTPPASTCRTTK